MENETVEYFYPPDKLRLSPQQLELAAGLSISHAVGEIVPVDVNPEEHKAQGAWRMNATPLPAEGLAYIAEHVHKRAPELLEKLQTGEQSDRLHKIGELLAAGHTVMDTIPHSTISDIGLGHGLPVIALRNMGYDFRSATVVSQGVTMLGREFQGRVVSVPEYLAYMDDITWFVYPNTEKTVNSELAENVPVEMLKIPNGIVKTDMETEQSKGRLVITSAVNATSYILGKNGEHLLAGITPGAIDTMTHENTRVQKVIAEIMGVTEPVLELCDDPINATSADEVHDLVGWGMAHALGTAFPEQEFIYLDPRRGLTKEDFQ